MRRENKGDDDDRREKKTNVNFTFFICRELMKLNRVKSRRMSMLNKLIHYLKVPARKKYPFKREKGKCQQNAPVKHRGRF